MMDSLETEDSVPIVCIGMSAGAVSPLQRLFYALSARTGMAFVIIHHLRRHPTLLPTLLPSVTDMPVLLVESGMPIRPNHVYVIPSGTEVGITDATLELRPTTVRRGWSNVITIFLNSLAQSRHPGIAVILSGMDDDGAASLEAFKCRGGVVIVQAPGTADYPSMPLAAIKTGVVDYALPPEGIARQLEELADTYASLADRNA